MQTSEGSWEGVGEGPLRVSEAGGSITFTQPRHTTLQPYWLYAGMVGAALLLMSPVIAALFSAGMLLPKLLLPARVTVTSEALTLSAWVARTEVPWSSITSADVVGSGWRRHIKIGSTTQSRPVILNFGLFTDQDSLSRAILEAAGEANPAAKAALEAVVA